MATISIVPPSIIMINDAWLYRKDVTSITIPHSVTSIEDSAFYGCTNLTAIEIPDSVTTIGSQAFTSVTLPSGISTIAPRAFQACENLNSVEIPNSMTCIGDSAFMYCSHLTSIQIPNSVTMIETSAFLGCRSLTSVELPNSVSRIGSSAFRGCTALTTVKLPNSISVISPDTFYCCTSLADIQIPNSVDSIEKNAFFGCKALISIQIPSSVTIMKWAFNACVRLRIATIQKGNVSLALAPVGVYGSAFTQFAFNYCPHLVGGRPVCSTPKTRRMALRLLFWSLCSHGDYKTCRRLLTLTVMLVSIRLNNASDSNTPPLPNEIWRLILRCLRPHQIGVDDGGCSIWTSHDTYEDAYDNNRFSLIRHSTTN